MVYLVRVRQLRQELADALHLTRPALHRQVPAVHLINYSFI